MGGVPSGRFRVVARNDGIREYLKDSSGLKPAQNDGTPLYTTVILSRRRRISSRESADPQDSSGTSPLRMTERESVGAKKYKNPIQIPLDSFLKNHYDISHQMKGQKMEKLSKEHLIHSYECDQDGKLRLLTLFNLLQYMAESHADKLNVGYKDLIEKQICWVGSGYALHINRRPKWAEEVTFKTWPSGQTPVVAIRDFEVLDKEGNPLINVSSQWVLVDVRTGRPQPVKKHLESLESLSERALSTDFPKIPEIRCCDFEKRFYVRYDDIDINKHVNNAIYPVWASEGVPNDFRQAHEIENIEISFKRPAFFGDEIIVKTEINNNETYHQIVSSDGTKEFARAHIVWKKKTA